MSAGMTATGLPLNTKGLFSTQPYESSSSTLAAYVCTELQLALARLW